MCQMKKERYLLHNSSQDKGRVYEETAPTISTPTGGGHLPYVVDTLNEKTRNVDKALEVAQNLSNKTGKPVQLDVLHLKHGEIRPLSTYIPQNLDEHRCLQAGEPKELLFQPNQRIRRLTPVECERLQGFPEIESFTSFNIHNKVLCLDIQKSYANAEIRNHKLPKYVGYVESDRKKEIVLSVENNSVISNQQTNKPVQENVLISCVEGKVQIHNQEKSFLFADFVENQNLSVQHIKEEDFVQMLVGINTTLKKTIISGKGGLPQNEQSLIQVKNGKIFVKLSGNEITQPAVDVKKDLIILKEHLKFITLNHLNLENNDLNWITSFSYVISAINGFIQKETLKENISLDLYFREGWTAGVSDSQRYKQCGNAVTTNVIMSIIEKWLETNGDDSA